MWAAQVHRQRSRLLWVGIVALSCLPHVSAHALDVHPTAVQIQTALDQGKEVAEKRMPPDSFYVRFGVADEVQPKGFLITKLGALSVMAAHMALRGVEPVKPMWPRCWKADDAHQHRHLRQQAELCGGQLHGARSGGRRSSPDGAIDAQADRSVVWPKSPRSRRRSWRRSTMPTSIRGPRRRLLCIRRLEESRASP